MFSARIFACRRSYMRRAPTIKCNMKNDSVNALCRARAKKETFDHKL